MKLLNILTTRIYRHLYNVFAPFTHIKLHSEPFFQRCLPRYTLPPIAVTQSLRCRSPSWSIFYLRRSDRRVCFSLRGEKSFSHQAAKKMRPTLEAAAILSVFAFKLASAKDTSSPNKPISKPSCNKGIDVSVRYSGKSDRLYIESANGRTRGGCITLKQIWEQRDGEGPLYAVDKNGDIRDKVTGRWLLTDDLYVKDGITLKVGRDIFFCSTFTFQLLDKVVVSGFVPSSPRYVPSILIAHRVQHSHCSSTFIECC